MTLSITNVFIQKACNTLIDVSTQLNEEQREELSNKLIALCDLYSPGAFTPVENNDIYDNSDMD